jgi:hypothetical protein
MDFLAGTGGFIDALPGMIVRMWLLEVAVVVALAAITILLSGGKIRVSRVLAGAGLALLVIAAAAAFSRAPRAGRWRFELPVAEAPVHGPVTRAGHRHRSASRTPPGCIRVLTDPSQSTC